MCDLYIARAYAVTTSTTYIYGTVKPNNQLLYIYNASMRVHYELCVTKSHIDTERQSGPLGDFFGNRQDGNGRVVTID